MDDVYLLTNLCSKNGMTGNCQGSAGSGQVDDITFSPDNRNSITLQKGGSSTFFGTVCYSCYVGIQVSYHLNLVCFQLCRLNTVKDILSHRCHAGNSEWPSPPPCTCWDTVDTFGSCLVLCSLLFELIFSQFSATKMFRFASLRPSFLFPFSLLPIFVSFSFSVEKLSEVCILQQWEAVDWLALWVPN